MASQLTQKIIVIILWVLVFLYASITVMQYFSLKTALAIRQTQQERAQIGTDIQRTTHLNDARLRRIEAHLGIASPNTTESLTK